MKEKIKKSIMLILDTPHKWRRVERCLFCTLPILVLLFVAGCTTNGVGGVGIATKTANTCQQCQACEYTAYNTKISYLTNYSNECYGKLIQLKKDCHKESELCRKKTELSTISKDTEKSGKWQICPTCKDHLSCNSNSMKPTLTCSNTIDLYMPPKWDVMVGDIIAFESSEYKQYRFIVHRIISYDHKDDCWNTAGDGNQFPDKNCTMYDNIKGKVYRITY